MAKRLTRIAQLAVMASLCFAPAAAAKDGINDFKTRPNSDTPWKLVRYIAMYTYDTPPADPKAKCNSHPSGGHMFNWTWVGGSTVTTVGAFSPPQWGNLKHKKYVLICNFDPDNPGYDLSRHEVEMDNCHFYICDTHFRVHRLERDNLYLTYTIDVGIEGLAKIHFKDADGKTYKCYDGDCTLLDRSS